MKRLLLAVASAVLLAGCAAAPAELAGVLFIDVGKGDAALVMAEDGATWWMRGRRTRGRAWKRRSDTMG
jgi:opacity protein-like surface antigen